MRKGQKPTHCFFNIYIQYRKYFESMRYYLQRTTYRRGIVTIGKMKSSKNSKKRVFLCFCHAIFENNILFLIKSAILKWTKNKPQILVAIDTSFLEIYDLSRTNQSKNLPNFCTLPKTISQGFSNQFSSLSSNMQII